MQKINDIKPKKSLGQNFLTSKSLVSNIIAKADIEPGDTILEIGPGTGILTVQLASKAKKVFAIEKDKNLVELLNKKFKQKNNVKIIHGDALKIDLALPLNYKVIANIPFYITAPLIRKYLEAKYPPSKITLIIQKEVAQRICAKPPRMSLLALSVQFYAQVKIMGYIKKEAFWPKPKVDSAIIQIIPYNNGSNVTFFKIIKAGFSHPRKQLAGNLSQSLNMQKEIIKQRLLENDVNPTQRAETLRLEDWLRLTKTFDQKNKR